MPAPRQYKDYELIGKHYGRLEILKTFHRLNKQNHKIRYAACLCDCKNVCAHRLGDVLKGNVVSCGCYISELLPVMHTYIKRWRAKHGR